MAMTKFLTLGLLGIVLSLPQTVAYAADYEVELMRVEKTLDTEVLYATASTLNEGGITKYGFQDGLVQIVAYADREAICFELSNAGLATERILWDGAVLVTPDGYAHRIIHQGIRYADVDREQLPSVLLHGSRIADMALPADHLHFDAAANQWHVDPLLTEPTKDSSSTLRLMLPIEIRGVVNEYVLEFKVNQKE